MSEAPTQLQADDGFAETPELHERIDRVGFGLIGGATVMFFLGFVFAYFYLRSINGNGLWRPAGVTPPDGYGIAIAAALALSALAFGYAARAAKRREGGWVAASGIALALGLFACVAQCVEYAHLSFGPESGGYASVFFGWTALYVVVALVALWRVETTFAARPPPPRRRRQGGARGLRPGGALLGPAGRHRDPRLDHPLPGLSECGGADHAPGMDRRPGPALGRLRGPALLARGPGEKRLEPRRALANRRLRRRPGGDRRRARLADRRPRRRTLLGPHGPAHPADLGGGAAAGAGPALEPDVAGVPARLPPRRRPRGQRRAALGAAAPGGLDRRAAPAPPG